MGMGLTAETEMVTFQSTSTGNVFGTCANVLSGVKKLLRCLQAKASCIARTSVLAPHCFLPSARLRGLCAKCETNAQNTAVGFRITGNLAGGRATSGSLDRAHAKAEESIVCVGTVLATTVFFEESFDDISWKQRWVSTKAKQYEGFPYGTFEWTPGKLLPDTEDPGLRTTEANSYFLTATKCPNFSNRNITLVIQHTVKYETFRGESESGHCAAGFVKLYPANFDPKKVTGDSKYIVKHGPDLCPTAVRTEATLFHKGKYYDHRPRRDIWDRKVYIYSPMVTIPKDRFTHLFTFVIFPNNTYHRRIDGEVVETGFIDEDYMMSAYRNITVKKERPNDWDDREEILDPTEQKPVNWEEEEYVPDPHATLPEDWDEAADGEWSPPEIVNPNYKGPWQPTRLIPNPHFDGPWIEEKAPNPDYKYDPEAYLLEDIGGVGIDVWQEQTGTVFDNILITDDLDYALKVGLKKQKHMYDLEYKIFVDECNTKQKTMEEHVKRTQMQKLTKANKKNRRVEL